MRDDNSGKAKNRSGLFQKLGACLRLRPDPFGLPVGNPFDTLFGFFSGFSLAKAAALPSTNTNTITLTDNYTHASLSNGENAVIITGTGQTLDIADAPQAKEIIDQSEGNNTLNCGTDTTVFINGDNDILTGITMTKDTKQILVYSDSYDFEIRRRA
jgi:hypothetical protein